MTRSFPSENGFDFTDQVARADLATFTRWDDWRGLLSRPSLAECEASLSRPRESSKSPGARMRDAA